MTNFETLLYDVTDGVAVISINRPEVRNALSRTVLADIRAALAMASDDEKVGVLVFTGVGDKAFIADADINQLREYTLHTGLESEMQQTFDIVESFPKPT